jgi:hypothetical protein
MEEKTKIDRVLATSSLCNAAASFLLAYMLAKEGNALAAIPLLKFVLSSAGAVKQPFYRKLSLPSFLTLNYTLLVTSILNQVALNYSPDTPELNQNAALILFSALDVLGNGIAILKEKDGYKYASLAYVFAAATLGLDPETIVPGALLFGACMINITSLAAKEIKNRSTS